MPRTAAHAAPPPDRRAIPADLPYSPTSNSQTHHAHRTERRTAAASRSRESMATKEREAGTVGEGAGARGGRNRRGAAVAGRAGERNDTLRLPLSRRFSRY